jgi:choline dehydrogenase-like flavoprotein
VTKLIKSGEESGIPTFRKAEIHLSPSKTPIVLTARNEIILSAGVINTPQILIRSGIGPASSLSALDIPVIVDLPSVGKNLTDHPMTSMFFRARKPTTKDAILFGSLQVLPVRAVTCCQGAFLFGLSPFPSPSTHPSFPQ